jgi:hypothetical protein
MNKKQLTALTLLLVAANNAFCAEWSSIIKNADHEIFVDIDSYDVANGIPYILTKTTFKNTQSLHLNKKSVMYQYQVKNTLFNCKQAVFKVTSIDFYSKQNQLLITQKPTTALMPIITGTDEYAVGQLVCQVHQMVGGQ